MRLPEELTDPQRRMLRIVSQHPGRSMSELGAIAYRGRATAPVGSRYARQAARVVWRLKEWGMVMLTGDRTTGVTVTGFGIITIEALDALEKDHV